MKFYVVNNRRFNDSEFAFGEEFEDTEFGPAATCRTCNSALTLMKLVPPFRINLSQRNIGDFVFGTYFNFLVSRRFKELFVLEELRGIRTFTPVSLYFENKVLSEQYFYPEIELASVSVDLEKSGITFEGANTCEECVRSGRIIKKMNGLHFEKPDQIQLDIFNPLLITELVVSGRLHDLIGQQQLTNISMIESSKFKPSWVFD